MRKHKYSPLIIFTLIFMAFTLGFLLGSVRHRTAITVNVPVSMLTEPARAPEKVPDAAPPAIRVTFPLDINRADKNMLMQLPGIGEIMAQRIIDYRDKHGAFSAVEELLNVDGMGMKKLDKIWDLIMIGG